jgi:threonine/homoserine/homoserine lactone efflux protein
MKSTFVMLGTVAVVVILTASAVLVWSDHRPYLIGVAVVGGATLAYAGWRWKRKWLWKRNAQGS